MSTTDTITPSTFKRRASNPSVSANFATGSFKKAANSASSKYETPKRMIKRAAAPPPLSLTADSATESLHSLSTVSSEESKPLSGQYRAALASSIPSYSSSSLSLPQRKRSQINSKCAFCQELLLINLPGETVLELTCSHYCHRDCLTLMFEKDDLEELPLCERCGERTRCVDDTVHSSLIHQVLVLEQPFIAEMSIDTQPSASSVFPNPRPNYRNPVTPLSQIIPDAQDPLPNLETNIQHLTLSRLEEEEDDNLNPLKSHIYEPIVTFSSDIDMLRLTKENTYELNYLLTVKAPQIFQTPPPKDHIIKTQVVHMLERNIENWVQHFNNPKLLGDLVMFDFLSISTNGTEWVQIGCFLFENIMVLIEGSTLVGQVLIHTDISSVNKFKDGITLNLRNETIPELSMKHENQIIVKKWEMLFDKVTDLQDLGGLSIFQFTTNGWPFIEKNGIEVPKEVAHFSQLISNNERIPNHFLAKAIPPPDALPLNLIVSVPLINATSLPDYDYKLALVSSLRSIQASLRPIDKLGLIFVGTDGRGKPSRSGSFMACVEANWNGWERLFEDLKVSSNFRNSVAIFSDDLQELQVSIEKCMDLYPFIPRNPKVINKLMILNCNSIGPSVSGSLEQTSSVLSNMINSLLEVLSITIVRIGNDYSEGVRHLHALVGNPNSSHREINSTASPKTSSRYTNAKPSDYKFCFGSSLLRFFNFMELNSELKYLVSDKFQAITVPEMIIDITPDIRTKPLVKFSKLEVNGELIPMNNLETFKIIIKDLLPHNERNIMMKIKIDMNLMDLTSLFESLDSPDQLPVLSYGLKWFGENRTDLTLITKLSDLRPSSAFNDFSLTSLLHTSISGSMLMDIPAPLSPNRDQSYARRQTELAIVNSLRIARFSPANEAKDVLMSAVSMAYGLTRGLSSMEDDSQRVDESILTSTLRLECSTKHIYGNLKEYIHFLVAELKEISYTFDTDAVLGSIKCEDLAGALV